MKEGPVAGIVLAAGASLRMGRPKALLDAGGTSFLGRLVGALAAGGCRPVVAVCSNAGGETALEATRSGAMVVVNSEGQGGQIGSLRVGLQALMGSTSPPPAVVFTPVDNPRVAAGTIGRLIQAWRAEALPVVIPEFAGKRGHPVLVDASLFSELLADDLPEGARSVLRRDPHRVLTLPVSDPATIDDVDTRDDYRRFSRPPEAEA